jgi:hypothetical protein
VGISLVLEIKLCGKTQTPFSLRNAISKDNNES